MQNCGPHDTRRTGDGECTVTMVKQTVIDKRPSETKESKSQARRSLYGMGGGLIYNVKVGDFVSAFLELFQNSKIFCGAIDGINGDVKTLGTREEAGSSERESGAMVF